MWLAAGLALAGCSNGKDGSDTGSDTNTTQPVDTGTPFSQTGDARVQAILAKLDQGVAADGHAQYSLDCAACHLESGEGGGGFPSLIDTLPGLTDEQLVKIMLAGFPEPPGGVPMPAYEDIYTNQQMVDVIAYVEVTFNPSR